MRVLRAPAALAHRPPSSGARQESLDTETEESIVIRTTGRRGANALPDTYFKLVRRHPLTSIRTEAELDAAQTVLDALLRQHLDDGGSTYLDALSDLVIVYERDHHAVAPLPPHDLLAHMLAERAMSLTVAFAMPVARTRSACELVSGKRRFTVDQMHAVAQVFGLPGNVFMPSPATD